MIMSFAVDPPDASAPASDPNPSTPATPPSNSSVPDDVQAKLAETLGIPAESLEASGDVVSGPEPGVAPAPAAELAEPEPSFNPEAFRARLAAEKAAAQEKATLMGFGPAQGAVTVAGVDTFVSLGEAAQTVVDKVAGKLPDSWKDKMAETENGAQTAFAKRAQITQRVKRAIDTTNSALSEVETEGLEVVAQLLAHIKAGEASAKAAWGALAKHAQEVADSL
jgi:hypothetical protein